MNGLATNPDGKGLAILLRDPRLYLIPQLLRGSKGPISCQPWRDRPLLLGHQKPRSPLTPIREVGYVNVWLE
jgi:hypothetical protein